MSLYDDLDVKTRGSENVQGWSSGIKLLQSQLQLKKATVTQPKRDAARKASLAPVIDLKAKQRDEEELFSPAFPQIVKPSKVEPAWPIISQTQTVTHVSHPASTYGSEYDWNVVDEYDPLWPNEYEKVVKDMRDKRDKDRDWDRDRDTEKEEKRKEKKRKSRFNDPAEETSPPPTVQMTQPAIGSGFAGRWADEEDMEPIQKQPRPSGGAAIAPPPSLQEPLEPVPLFPNKPQPSTSYGASSIAAKIMAKYGFKEGQGLGKQEQGMASALQVEKTSKRGGRIIHEKEMPSFPPSTDEHPPVQHNLTELMKNPSKVVLLKNMVGPGEVDDDLEPEVKDECNTKYGPVANVIINEIQHENPDECVRIFVEFLRIESAIKAVVDLNGRFFGGRMVNAGFYDTEKYDNLELMD